MKLFCRILDESKGAFSVNIDENQTVEDLQKEIVKGSVTFANVDWWRLTLWKVVAFLHFH